MRQAPELGEDRLRDPQDPDAAINRRVQLINIGGLRGRRYPHRLVVGWSYLGHKPARLSNLAAVQCIDMLWTPNRLQVKYFVAETISFSGFGKWLVFEVSPNVVSSLRSAGTQFDQQACGLIAFCADYSRHR